MRRRKRRRRRRRRRSRKIKKKKKKKKKRISVIRKTKTNTSGHFHTKESKLEISPTMMRTQAPAIATHRLTRTVYIVLGLFSFFQIMIIKLVQVF